MKIMVHAGAGSSRSDPVPVQRVLCEALEAARQSQEALQACLSAVKVLEDCPLLNAGRGSALAEDGKVYMDASVMCSSGDAGAVCGLSRVRYPSQAAAALLSGEVVMWAGHEQQLIDRFELSSEEEEFFYPPAPSSGSGTVGAVCLDDQGELCAVTSTGGMAGKTVGRVGDSAVIGAGTWCSGLAAVSCTGAGESFILSAAAFQVERRLGDGLKRSGELALRDAQARGGLGGLIAVSCEGEMAAVRSAEAMQWASIDGNEVSFGD